MKKILPIVLIGSILFGNNSSVLAATSSNNNANSSVTLQPKSEYSSVLYSHGPSTRVQVGLPEDGWGSYQGTSWYTNALGNVALSGVVSGGISLALKYYSGGLVAVVGGGFAKEFTSFLLSNSIKYYKVQRYYNSYTKKYTTITTLHYSRSGAVVKNSKASIVQYSTYNGEVNRIFHKYNVPASVYS